MEFQGLSEETYKFFWEIAFHNNVEFFEENRARYKAVVQQPMLALAEALGPVAGDIDPNFNLRPSSVVSRIRRDTRFTKDKSPYRDHMWLAFKYQDKRLSEGFVLYTQFEREGYSYGMGMYSPMPELMSKFRARILARPSLFLALLGDIEKAGLSISGEEYKRRRFPDAPEALQPFINKKSISFNHFDPDVKKTFSPDVTEEIKAGFLAMKPMYRFLMGLE